MMGLERASAILIVAFAVACRGEVLDLGHEDIGAPRYATPETIASEQDAGPGVPTIIASNQYGAIVIAVDERRVYWAEQAVNPVPPAEKAVVRSCAKEDCAGTLVTYAINQYGVRRLAVNETDVFWTVAYDTGSYSIVACPIAGCNGPPSDIALGLRALDFGLDESFIYLLTSEEGVVRCPIHGCQGTPTVLATPSALTTTFAFAVGSTHVFWTEGQALSNNSGRIMMVPKDGSAGPHALAEGGHLVDSLRNDQANLYWVEGYAAGTVKSCAMPNCDRTMTTLASSQRYPHLLDINGDRASWFVLTGGVLASRINLAGAVSMGQLVECPMTGCNSPLTILASDEPTPAALASDATHIYWITYRDGAPQGSAAIPAGTVKRIRRSR